MKKSLFIFLVIVSQNLFSQTDQIKTLIKKISASDSVFFVVNTSGCFNGGVQEYKLVKQKSGGRKVIYLNNGKLVSKGITSKQYMAFVKKYQVSALKFTEDKNPTCTLVTDFELTNKKMISKFTNGTCENEFNPEPFLTEMLK